MIEVQSEPIIEACQGNKWQLVFWMGEAFDYTTPFRAALAEIGRRPITIAFGVI